VNCFVTVGPWIPPNDGGHSKVSAGRPNDYPVGIESVLSSVTTNIIFSRGEY
jgi:hypothetical protein